MPLPVSRSVSVAFPDHTHLLFEHNLSAVVRSKVVALLLMIHCLLLLPIFVGVLCLVLDLLCST